MRVSINLALIMSIIIVSKFDINNFTSRSIVTGQISMDWKGWRHNVETCGIRDDLKSATDFSESWKMPNSWLKSKVLQKCRLSKMGAA